MSQREDDKPPEGSSFDEGLGRAGWFECGSCCLEILLAPLFVLLIVALWSILG